MKPPQQDRPESDLPEGLAEPARRALNAAGYTQLEQLCRLNEVEIKRLHGIGPKALNLLRDALREKGLSFKDGKQTANGREQDL